MKNLFLHDFQSSFFLWANHQITDKAEAWGSGSGSLALYNDKKLSGYYCYQGPRKPWIADASIAAPITGIGVGTGVMTSGYHVDYQNGRIISQTNLGTGVYVKYNYQEVSVELNSSSEQSIIFENKFVENQRFYQQKGQVPPDTYVTPIVFLSVDHHENTPFSFGGEDETKVFAKAVVICENDQQREAILSVFSDSSNTNFPAIPADNFPYNAFFDAPSGYNYENLKAQYADDVYVIDKVKASRMSRTAQAEIPQNLSVGFVDFQICKLRYPRA